MMLTMIAAIQKDLKYLVELRKLTMSEYLLGAGLNLSEAENLARINNQFEDIVIIWKDKQKIGMIKSHSTAGLLKIAQLQIHPDFQGQGIGTLLMQDLIKAAKLNQQIIRLSVLKNNPARFLYKRLGFVQVGEDQYEYFMQLTFTGI